MNGPKLVLIVRDWRVGLRVLTYLNGPKLATPRESDVFGLRVLTYLNGPKLTEFVRQKVVPFESIDILERS